MRRVSLKANAQSIDKPNRHHVSTSVAAFASIAMEARVTQNLARVNSVAISGVLDFGATRTHGNDGLH